MDIISINPRRRKTVQYGKSGNKKAGMKRTGGIRGEEAKIIQVMPDMPMRDNFIVLMAGGKGSRLRPLTDEIPKPMLKVGDKPILEIIINQFRSFGFKNFIVSISYLAHIVEGYFGDGSDYGVSISYIRETKRLGTAGCLKLAKQYLNKPFYVMNGDLLANIDFKDMLGFHIENGFDITMGIRKYQYRIPYGVVETDGNRVAGLVEKPVNSCTINAGVYCLNPGVIEYISGNEYFDITTLVDTCIQKGGRAGGYDIKGYWTDIGQIEDYNRANLDYGYSFKDDAVLKSKNEKIFINR